MSYNISLFVCGMHSCQIFSKLNVSFFIYLPTFSAVINYCELSESIAICLPFTPHFCLAVC